MLLENFKYLETKKIPLLSFPLLFKIKGQKAKEKAITTNSGLQVVREFCNTS